MTLAGKMLTLQVSAAVRLQAATRGLLARRRVREMRDLQLIQPCTPRSSSKLRFAVRRTSISSAASGISGMRLPPRAAGMLFSLRAAVGEAHPSTSFSIESPPLFSVRCRPAAV
ncbi:unnamed protein product [Miscanthus lutarioriparius]|uniref:Uncharacterized protein n=1 Tax=Miscanthus lutarioriparius TaxID=422564 RepID=A0A811MA57_9POAL|nr:unnamed protein product [Miscanthus lutarioriparius]